MKRNLRGAFTLVEVLVVIAIVGMLVALLLPAVQSAREAARRATCQNNLAQLGLALHLHHVTHGRLPPGVRNDAGPIRHEPKGKHHSWLTQILPYLEQGNAYDQIDFAAGVYDRANLPVRMLSIKFFACPSQRSDGPASDYAGCHHDAEAPIDADNHGVLFLNSAVRYDEISDGRSHTLFVGEKLTEEDAEKAMPEVVDGVIVSSGGGAFAGEGDVVPGDEGQAPPDEPLPELDFLTVAPGRPTDFGWMSGTRATLRNTGTPINDRRRQKNAGVTEEPPRDEAALAAQAAAHLLRVGGFESNHMGGAQFVLGDGSVRFLSENVSTQVYRRLAHRADGQLLDEAGY